MVGLDKINFDNNNPFVLIAGPCMIESEEHAFFMAQELKKITDNLKKRAADILFRINRLSLRKKYAVKIVQHSADRRT